jgi:hypothetical protein
MLDVTINSNPRSANSVKPTAAPWAATSWPSTWSGGISACPNESKSPAKPPAGWWRERNRLRKLSGKSADGEAGGRDHKRNLATNSRQGLEAKSHARHDRSTLAQIAKHAKTTPHKAAQVLRVLDQGTPELKQQLREEKISPREAVKQLPPPAPRKPKTKPTPPPQLPPHNFDQDLADDSHTPAAAPSPSPPLATSGGLARVPGYSSASHRGGVCPARCHITGNLERFSIQSADGTLARGEPRVRCGPCFDSFEL